jgi:outer membrane protein assembly factor BamB
VVYAGSRDGVTVAFDAETGEERWRTDTTASAIASTGSDVLLGRRQASSVRDGRVRWRVDIPNNWTTGITSTGRWYLTGSRVEGDGHVLAVSPGGDERWRHRLTGDGVALTPVVNGRLVVGVEGERPGVHQFTTDGESAWFFETETSVVDVVFTGDWTWALTASGRVLALSQ